MLAHIGAVTLAIHRLIELHAATHGLDTAIVDGDRSCSYRELNVAANAFARHLMTRGLRRGAHVYIRIKPSVDLGVALLAVLKAGAVYTLIDADGASVIPEGIAICVDSSGREQRYEHVGDLPWPGDAYSPNLPVVCRPTDIACLLESGTGDQPLMVPHATIASMRSRLVTSTTPWTGAPGAFDLWIALMNGSAAAVHGCVETAAA